MRKLTLGALMAFWAAAVAGCASDGWISGPPGVSECPASASTFHEREGLPAVRPGDCRPAPAMKVPFGD